MSSINDVLKEKFNVSGSNIAETLSKIEPGSGGGSSDNVLTVEVTFTDDSPIVTLNKTYREISNAFPNVRFTMMYDGDGEVMKNTTSAYQIHKSPVGYACAVQFVDMKYTFSSDTEDGVMQYDRSKGDNPMA